MGGHEAGRDSHQRFRAVWRCVWCILKDEESSYAYPQGVTGDQELLARLQEIPGFHSEEVFKVIRCTGNRVCGPQRG